MIVWFEMRVMFVIGLPAPSPGAAWTRIESFLRALMWRGHQGVVICSERRGLNPYIMSAIFGGRGVFSAISFFTTTFINVLRYKPDLVVISVPPGIHAFGASVACCLLNRRVIFDYRDRWEDYLINKTKNRVKRRMYGILKFFMSLLYSRATLVLTVIPPFVEHLSQRGVKNICVLPNGADTNVFKPAFEKEYLRIKYGFKKDDFILVYSGYIGKYYRLDVCVKALAKLYEMNVSKNVKLMLIGEGEDLEGIFSLSKMLNVEGKVVYMGVKHDKRELAELIALSDSGLIPYDKNPLWKEALPTKFFEYSSCGIPTIATVQGDSLLAKIIDREKVGIHVEPEKVEDLANAIALMLSDREFLLNASKKARELIEREFDRVKISQKFVDMIEKLSYNFNSSRKV
jgi:colanic acid biosynthesis glycosyl transferase WcaI